MAAKGPKNRSRQAKPETPEKRRYQPKKAPRGLQLTEPLILLHLLLPLGSRAAPGLSFPSFAGDPASGHSGHLTGGNPAHPNQQAWWQSWTLQTPPPTGVMHPRHSEQLPLEGIFSG